MNNLSMVGIAIAAGSLTMAVIVHIILVAKAWGSFKAILEELKVGAEKLEGLIERLFERTEQHGNRLTALEVQRSTEKETPQKVVGRR